MIDVSTLVRTSLPTTAPGTTLEAFFVPASTKDLLLFVNAVTDKVSMNLCRYVGFYAGVHQWAFHDSGARDFTPAAVLADPYVNSREVRFIGSEEGGYYCVVQVGGAGTVGVATVQPTRF